MNSSKKLGLLATLGLTALAMSVTAPTEAAGITPYRRWIDNKTFSCDASGTDGVVISNQDIELSGLPAGSEYTMNYIVNGTNTPSGPYPVEDTTGTRNYGAFFQPGAYPITFEFRLDTIVEGVVVYSSSLIMTCTADGGPFEVHPVNVDVANLPPSGSSTTWPLTIAAAGCVLVGAAATGIGLRRRHS